MDVLTYDELRVIEREERDNKKLSSLGQDFLERYYAYVKDKQRVLDKSDDNLIAKKVKDRTKNELFNARNSFKSIFEYRARKVFDQVLLDMRMGVSPELDGLLDFEKRAYEDMRKVLSGHFNSLNKGNLKKGVNSQEIKDKNLLVRFVKDLPKFAWEGLILGPFSSEDVANLPKEVVRLLLDKGVVKEVNDDE
jgi:DNA replication initiation complex subunit (GINS family)